MSKPVSTSLLEYYKMIGSAASPRATQECAKSFAYTDFRDDVLSVNVPTLIIHGDADKTVPIEATGDVSSKLIPQSTYIRYEDAPHGLFVTHKERLTKDLIHFIREEVIATV
jgi:pimeloyl-ACP methyl ester carboxylesterase